MLNPTVEYKRWLACADEETKKELESLSEDDVKFAFSAPLSFGTGGLRGILMPGIGAMNKYTVAQATQGLADFLSEIEGAAARGVLVGYDSRNHSHEFAGITASVLAANGFRVWLYDGLRPVPMTSFGVRQLGCVAGVHVTASHNPKEYNGYKVYFEDGAQINAAQAAAISAAIAAADIFTGIRSLPLSEAVAAGKVTMVGAELDEIYLEKVLAQRVDPSLLPAMADELKIVYTPFHGVGYKMVPEALRRAGLKELYPVPEQMVLDGNFPTVKSPNPENPEGFALGIALAEKVGSDLVVGTDPDCDRVGVVARGADGRFETITGNRMGALLLDYILAAHTENGTMPPRPYAVKTIVTTNLAQAICDRYGVELYNVLTGFKYIGEIMTANDESRPNSFILGYEESYGYLKGCYARDKDGVVAALLICEMAAYYKRRGMTLLDAQQKMLERYGFYTERTENLVMPGLGGKEKMAALMEKIRVAPPASLGGKKVVAVRDYLAGEITTVTGEKRPTGLPKSDVLYFELEGGSAFIVRPSGTEPKIKVYLLATAPTKEESDALSEALRQEIGRL